MSRQLHLSLHRLALACAWLLCQCAAADEPLQPVAEYRHLAQPLLEQYCYDCHMGDSADGGIAIDALKGSDDFQQDRTHWQKVLARLKSGDMPPPDYDAPTLDERNQLVEWIDTRLNQLDCNGPQDPGWITLRRLNRDQYRNTIRDLLGIDFQPNKTFPPDMLAYGFDNNADMLSLTPVLLEKYLDASREIARQAIPTPETYAGKIRNIAKDKWQGGQFDSEDSRDLWTNGAVEFVYRFDRSGRYWLRVRVSASQAGDDPVQMSLMLDGQPVQTVDVHATQEESEVFAFAVDATEGKHRLGVAFRNDYYDQTDKTDRNLFVKKLEVLGTGDDTLANASPAYGRWFAHEPAAAEWYDAQAWRPQVEQTLRQFAFAAYRRPAPPEEIARLLSLIDSRRQAGDSYQRAMQIALQVMLVSPRFLYIGNVDQQVPPAGETAPGFVIDEYELAARLSYFLWTSTPDATLLRLAHEGRLRAELEPQIARMLRDRRSEQFTTNFPGQWLGTRLLADFQPAESEFDALDDDLRDAMAREASLVFADIVRQDLPVTTLLNADFTYLNERLAKHYGIQGVEGGHFRRVTLAELPPYPGVRGGVLTMAGVLAATSNPDRTSPVKRGKWVLSEIMNEPPPAPPPGVTSLEVVAQHSDRPLSIREQMERHRADPSCAVCHQKMDPIGLALDNYDLVGRWRTEDSTGPLDTSGELPTGEHLDGVADLRDLLVQKPEAFRRSLTEKMLIYALGRGLEYYDECAVREITDRVAHQDDRMQSLIVAIVESTPFQQRRSAATQP